MIVRVILGKNLKVGDVFPGGTSEYDRVVKRIETEYRDYHKQHRKIHPTIFDTYRTAYFEQVNGRVFLPMTIFDNYCVNIAYKKISKK